MTGNSLTIYRTIPGIRTEKNQIIELAIFILK